MARHGGRRAGSGRKPKSVRFATKITAVDKVFADALKDSAARLLELGQGGIEIVERKYQPAGLITIKIDYVKDNGDVAEGLERLAFPDLPPDALVCIEEKRSVTLPDRAALVYACDRLLGRPHTEPAPVEEDDQAGSYAETEIPKDAPDIEPRHEE